MILIHTGSAKPVSLHGSVFLIGGRMMIQEQTISVLVHMADCGAYIPDTLKPQPKQFHHINNSS